MQICKWHSPCSTVSGERRHVSYWWFGRCLADRSSSHTNCQITRGPCQQSQRVTSPTTSSTEPVRTSQFSGDDRTSTWRQCPTSWTSGHKYCLCSATVWSPKTWNINVFLNPLRFKFHLSSDIYNKWFVYYRLYVASLSLKLWAQVCNLFHVSHEQLLSRNTDAEGNVNTLTMTYMLVQIEDDITDEGNMAQVKLSRNHVYGISFCDYMFT